MQEQDRPATRVAGGRQVQPDAVAELDGLAGADHAGATGRALGRVAYGSAGGAPLITASKRACTVGMICGCVKT